MAVWVSGLMFPAAKEIQIIDDEVCKDEFLAVELMVAVLEHNAVYDGDGLIVNDLVLYISLQIAGQVKVRKLDSAEPILHDPLEAIFYFLYY